MGEQQHGEACALTIEEFHERACLSFVAFATSNHHSRSHHLFSIRSTRVERCHSGRSCLCHYGDRMTSSATTSGISFS